jgi:hypothetical protein
MKKTLLIVAFVLSGFVFKTATAQVHVRFNVNIGTQPVWGPVGYDHVEYYYMPDIDAYYYVPSRQYIYQDRGRWIFSSSLPYRYHNYDVYNGYKVVINNARPYRNDRYYRTKYAGYRNNHSQEAIRNSHDSRYFVNKDHPEHNNWKSDNNGRDRGNNDHQNRGNNHQDRGNNNHQDRGNNGGGKGHGHHDN